MSEVSPVRVILLGIAIVGLGAVGFHEIPGMIAEEAEGSRLVNAMYCSIITLTTVGFGDICPGNIDAFGRTFIVLLSFSGLGLFCGPIMDMAASWKNTLADEMGVLLFCVLTCIFVFTYILDEMSESEAAYFSIITGTTIGYGDISPKSDAGKIAVALYAVCAVNVVASLLEKAKEYLLDFCKVPSSKKATTPKASDKISKEAAVEKIDKALKETSHASNNGEKSEENNGGESPTKSKKKKKKKKKGGAASPTKKNQ